MNRLLATAALALALCAPGVAHADGPGLAHAGTGPAPAAKQAWDAVEKKWRNVHAETDSVAKQEIYS